MRLILFLVAIFAAALGGWWWFLGPRTTTINGVVGPANSINITAQVRSDQPLGAPGVGFEGRGFRLRYWDIKPGGVVPLHSHEGRPATIYVVNGEILEFQNGAHEPIRHQGGELSSESGGLVHYWRNDTPLIVNLVASDIYANPKAGAHPAVTIVRTLEKDGASGTEIETLATIDLGREAIGVSGRMLRTRRITIAPGGDSGALEFSSGPGNAFILDGTVTQSRSDLGADRNLVRNDSDEFSRGVGVRWRNASGGPAVLIVSDIAETAEIGSPAAESARLGTEQENAGD